MWVSWSKAGQKKKWNASFRLHKIDMAWTWNISNWSSAAVRQLTLMINTRKIIYRKNEVTSHFFFVFCGSHSLGECELYWDMMNGPRRRNENRFRRVFARSRLSPTVAALKLKRILGRLFFPLQTATARAGGSVCYARERTSIELRRKCVYGKPRAARRARYATAMGVWCAELSKQSALTTNTKYVYEEEKKSCSFRLIL